MSLVVLCWYQMEHQITSIAYQGNMDKETRICHKISKLTDQIEEMKSQRKKSKSPKQRSKSEDTFPSQPIIRKYPKPRALSVRFQSQNTAPPNNSEMKLESTCSTNDDQLDSVRNSINLRLDSLRNAIRGELRASS